MNKLSVSVLLLLIPFCLFSQRAKLYQGLPEKSYYKNGVLRVEREFVENQLAAYKTFYKNGQLRSSHIFNSKGYHDGIANFYYPNGKIKTVWKYKKGVVKKRTNYTIKGEVIKISNNKNLRRINECNRHLPYGDGYLKWTYRRAVLNSKLGFYDEAMEDYLYLFSKTNLYNVKIDTERRVYHNLAIVYTHLEEYAKGIEYDFKALKLSPDNQSVLNNLGWLFNRVKDYDMAVRYLDKCLEVNPKNYHAFYNKAILYLEQGEYEKSLDFINKTIADERSHKYDKLNLFREQTIWTVRGENYLKLGRLDEAILDFEKEIEVNSINAFAYRCLGMAYKEKNELDKACEYLNKAQECKYDQIYNTNEVEILLKEICTSLSK